MINPVVTLVSGQDSHPFKGGKKARSYTKKHVPLVWECMLGTVYARDPKATPYDKDGGVRYFDYNYNKAREWANVAGCTDLRVCRVKVSYQGWPRKGQLVLWGIPPEKQNKKA